MNLRKLVENREHPQLPDTSNRLEYRKTDKITEIFT